MVIKPDIPRKVRVLQKIDCQKEEFCDYGKQNTGKGSETWIRGLRYY